MELGRNPRRCAEQKQKGSTNMAQEINFEVAQEALAIVRNTEITANFAEVKAALTEMVAPYKNAIVTEDRIADAKKDRARLRKVADRVDEMRKTVKRAYTEPLTAFEAKCKELVAICAEGSGNLDEQVKAFEKREADAKLAKLREEYEGYGKPEAREYCPWERIVNPKWANKSFAFDAAVGEIRYALDETADNLLSIRTMGGEDTAYLLDYYKDSRDIGRVMRKAGELKEAREREERRRVEEAAWRAQVEEARRRVEEERRRQEEAASQTVEQTAEQPEELPEAGNAVEAAEEELVSVAFRVTCTKAQLAALGAYMKAHGIRYGRAV